MIKHKAINTLRIAFLVLILLASVIPAGAEENAQERAAALNRQVDALLSRLDATTDTFTYYNTLEQAVKVALQCDQYDRLPNSKGKVTIKFRHGNSKRLAPLRPRLIDACMYYYGHHRNEEALKVLKTYLALSGSELFKGRKDLYKGQVAYYLSLLYYGTKNYTEADRCADIALRDVEYAKDAAEVKVSCMKELMVTPNDSARYVLALLELHDKAPHNSTYMRLLLEHFSLPGHESEMEQFAKDETNKKPRSKEAWALLGETKMRKKNWSDAIKAYAKAIELDTTFVEAIYNKGLCLTAKAQQTLQAPSAKTESVPTTPRLLLQEAQRDFEQVRLYDPLLKEVDWATPLYLVYKLLGENDKAEKIAPEVKKQNNRKESHGNTK